MLNLQGKIGKLDQETIDSPNLCDRFDKADLQRLGDWCWSGYDRDKRSRYKWEKRTEAAMDLAMQVQKAKSFPWANASNVAFPLVTIGTLQFHARAYPTLVDGPDIVQYRVIGADQDGSQRKRADRIGEHMSWQLMEEDQDWEEQHDRMLIHLPVVGTAFKKTFFSSSMGYNESEFVMAKDLVINYWAKSVETAARKTHLIPLYRNEVWERIENGAFRDIREEGWWQTNPVVQQSTQQVQADNRQGTTPASEPDDVTPFQFAEQHVLCDLDADGYSEPYIITFELHSHCVVRIVTGFEQEADIDRSVSGRIRSIKRMEQFTKYSFIPSPDGGLYDIGFGVLLGPLNESVNSLSNQLIDAGTLQTAAGGFLARGAKLRSGNTNVSPFGWTRVEVSGDDLRKSMVEYPVREPSNVLYQLLVLLVNYTQKISGTTDPMVGENPGQNQPAETTRTVVEMGQKIYSAIFKRIWRSSKEEFRKLYILNTVHMPETIPFGADGQQALREDYLGDPSRVAPVADPNVTSDTAKLQQAMTLKNFAQTTPGYDWEQVERRVLRALKVDGIDEVYVGPKSPKATPIPNPKAAVEQMKLQGKQMELQLRQQEFTITMKENVRMNNAKILELEAKAAQEMEQAGGVKEGHRIAAFEAAIGALKVNNEHIRGQIDLMLKSMEQKDEDANARGMGPVAGNAGDTGTSQVGAGQA